MSLSGKAKFEGAKFEGAKFEGAVQPWGNSLGIRITRPMSDMAHIGRGDKVAIEVTEDGLLIRRKKIKKKSLFPTLKKN